MFVKTSSVFETPAKFTLRVENIVEMYKSTSQNWKEQLHALFEITKKY